MNIHTCIFKTHLSAPKIIVYFNCFFHYHIWGNFVLPELICILVGRMIVWVLLTIFTFLLLTFIYLFLVALIDFFIDSSPLRYISYFLFCLIIFVKLVVICWESYQRESKHTYLCWIWYAWFVNCDVFLINNLMIFRNRTGIDRSLLFLTPKTLNWW